MSNPCLSLDEAAVTRPALRWHGGKWKLAPWILEHLPAHRVYVEPFGGAASVLLRKARSYAEVYNDLDSEVVNLFRVLRDAEQSAGLIRLLNLTPFSREEFMAAYEPCDDPVERARRLVLRSIYGSQDLELNEQHAIDFKYGRFAELATKPRRCGLQFPTV